MSAASLRTAVLRVLDRARPYALPASSLLDEVNQRVRPPVRAGELADTLGWLADQEMAGSRPDALAPEDAEARKWFIKEAGQNALA